MKPTGSAAVKKRRSELFKLSPEQPRMTARGCVGSACNDASDRTPLQLAADPIGIRYRPGLDPVVDPLVAEIGADGRRREIAEQIRILSLDPTPFLARRILAAYRAELK